jgi:hypothetical protein
MVWKKFTLAVLFLVVAVGTSEGQVSVGLSTSGEVIVSVGNDLNSSVGVDDVDAALAALGMNILFGADSLSTAPVEVGSLGEEALPPAVDPTGDPGGDAGSAGGAFGGFNPGNAGSAGGATGNLSNVGRSWGPSNQVVPGTPLPNGDRAAGSLAQGIFNGPGMATLWNSANSWGEAAFIGTGAAIALPAAVTVGWSAGVNLSARAVGLYAAFGGGTGVVLGQFDEYTNYIEAAESIGANALNVSRGAYQFFLNQGEFWTLNQTFLSTSMWRGQQFFMSSPVMGATGNYALELDYLMQRGIGPTQWQMVPLPY